MGSSIIKNIVLIAQTKGTISQVISINIKHFSLHTVTSKALFNLHKDFHDRDNELSVWVNGERLFYWHGAMTHKEFMDLVYKPIKNAKRSQYEHDWWFKEFADHLLMTTG